MVSSEHAVAALDLPPLHRDPFERMLLAQARLEGLSLVTSDELVARYPGDVRKV
jgi:PIN domain nuclease of toxin-antitoxin system